MIRLLGWSAAAFLTALLLVPTCRRLALKFGFVATPKEDRWHTAPTALLGGVAVAVTVLGLMVATNQARAIGVLLIAAGAICVIGLVDDLRSLKPSTKLIAVIGIASLLVFFGYRLQWVDSLTGDTLLTLVWIVGITNAFNLLDNMDGLCAGVAVIASVSLLAAFGSMGAQQPEAIYLALVLGTCAAFLVYNVHPASVFLGDSGSLFVGMSLATVALGSGGLTGGRPNVLAVIAVPALVLLIPIFDTTLVTLSRLLSGRRPSTGGLDHSSHRLVAIGLSERAAVTVLWVLAAIAGALGVITRYVSLEWSVLLAALFLLAMGIFAVYLANVRVYKDSELREFTNGTITPLVVNFVYRHRVAEVMLDACLVSVAYYAAYRLRFEGSEWGESFPIFLQSLPIMVGVQMVAFFVAGVYRGVWRHFSLMDVVIFVKGVVIGTVAVLVILVFVYRFTDYSRTVFVIHAVLLVFLLTGSRSSFRLMSEFVKRRRRSGDRFVVLGADDAGVAALREVDGQPESRLRMVGFIDDDQARHGTRVHGYMVLGGHDTLVSLIQTGEVETIVLTTDLAGITPMTDLKRLCADRGVTLLRIHVNIQHLEAG